jgi:hypothetical protein
MGFFSKIWKNVKKGFKKLFKPIKQVFKTFGKFMNKLGIVGQIAMMFIPIPGLGALMSRLGSLWTGAAQALGASGNAILRGAGTFMKMAGKAAKAITAPFKTISEAVSSTIGNTAKYIGNKMGFDITNAPTKFFGTGQDSVLGRTGKSITDNINEFTKIFEPETLKASKSADFKKYGDMTHSDPSERISPMDTPTMEYPTPESGRFAKVSTAPTAETFELNRDALLNATEDQLNQVGFKTSGAPGDAMYKVGDKTFYMDKNISGKQLEYANEMAKGMEFQGVKEGFFEGLGKKTKEYVTEIPGRFGERLANAPVDMAYQSLLSPDSPQMKQRSSMFIQPLDTSGIMAATQQALTPQSYDSDFRNYMVNASMFDVDPMGSWGSPSFYGQRMKAFA